MNLKKMKKEELETLSYADIAEIILNNSKKAMNTASIFKEICELLSLGENEYTDKIGDFYTSLTTDKRFILLENSEWDLRIRHKVEINLDDDELDDEYIEDSSEDAELEEASEDADESIEITDDEVDLDDDMEDLTIIDDDMEEDE